MLSKSRTDKAFYFNEICHENLKFLVTDADLINSGERICLITYICGHGRQAHYYQNDWQCSNPKFSIFLGNDNILIRGLHK